jgi:hypothetical protein
MKQITFRPETVTHPYKLQVKGTKYVVLPDIYAEQFCGNPCEETLSLYVWWTVNRNISVQKGPTGCTIYFSFSPINNLYMLRAALLLIIRRYYSVYTCVYVDWPVDINA